MEDLLNDTVTSSYDVTFGYDTTSGDNISFTNYDVIGFKWSS
jgi:hypothetical protein